MLKTRKIRSRFGLAAALAILTLTLTACSISTTSSDTEGSTSEAGVFLSTDNGSTWRPMVSVPTVSGRAQSIGNINVNTMVMDPQDSRAVYLASFDRGLYYTYNVTNGWNFVAGLPAATVNAVAVDPKNKCIIYAAVANRVYRSADCSRTWSQVYFDNNQEVNVNAIAIDHYNTRNIYLGTSRGEIIKSIDSGGAWRTIQRLDEGLARLIISPVDSRQIFLATAKNKIFSFISNTNTNPAVSEDLDRNFMVENWTDMNQVLKDFGLGTNFRELIITKDGVIFLASDKLFLRSPDGGISWENIKLIQPDKDATIGAVAVDPQNINNIYYVTNTSFFRSSDGGATWSTKSLPTKRAGRELLVDFKDPNVLYLGTVRLKD